MPHTRDRHLTPSIQKNLKFWPVICLVGARQVGKSTFLKQFKKFTYSTLDDSGINELAVRNPQSILTPPCILDEAQKAPALFDAVKMQVDQKRIPGQFILTGSVRFSKRTLIRESLTGRAKVIQLHPFMCSEALELPFDDRWSSTLSNKNARIKRADFERILSKGGMPGIFATRNSAEILSYWRTLIDSYIYRDLLFAVPKNSKPAVALKVLKSIAEILALGENPTFARILRKVGGTRSQVEKHLLGLEDLMIVNRVPHLGASSTKDIFLPFDTALFLSLLNLDSAQHDAAIHISCMQIRMLGEFLASRQITDQPSEVFYAESNQGHKIHLITKNTKNRYCFYHISEDAIPHDYELRFLRAQALQYQGSAVALTSTQKPVSLPSVLVAPWELML